jgi:hypothetical protein
MRYYKYILCLLLPADEISMETSVSRMYDAPVYVTELQIDGTDYLYFQLQSPVSAEVNSTDSSRLSVRKYRTCPTREI